MTDIDIQTESVISKEASSESNDVDMDAHLGQNSDSQLEEVLTCTNCQEVFSTSSLLDSHLQAIHNVLGEEPTSNVL